MMVDMIHIHDDQDAGTESIRCDVKFCPMCIQDRHVHNGQITGTEYGRFYTGFCLMFIPDAIETKNSSFVDITVPTLLGVLTHPRHKQVKL